MNFLAFEARSEAKSATSGAHASVAGRPRLVAAVCRGCVGRAKVNDEQRMLNMNGGGCGGCMPRRRERVR